MRRSLPFTLLCGLGTALAAQDPTPAAPQSEVLPVREWLAGEPVQFQGEHAARLVLLAFLPAPAALADHQEALAALQRRHAEAGLRVVALLPQRPAQKLQPPPFAVALGLDGGSGAPREPAVLCLFDGQTVSWQGTMVNGPDRVIADVLAGKLDGDGLQRLMQLHEETVSGSDIGFEYGAGDELLRATTDLLALNPTDGAVWALRYCVADQKLADASLAATVLREALTALSEQPYGLGWFCDVVLRSDQSTPGLGEAMWPLLTQAAPMAPADATLQLAALRALVRAGKDRLVGRLAQQLRKRFDGDPQALLHLAGILAGDHLPAVHRDVAAGAIDRAVELGASGDSDLDAIPLLLGVRYEVARRCADDHKAAQAIADALVERLGADNLNDCAWYSMVRIRDRGCCDGLAIELCRRMLENRAALPGNELDTVALGMFLDGKLQLAVELQQAAVQKAGGQSQYGERLHRYETALAAKSR